MTTDVEVLRSNELTVSRITAETAAGVEFVDAYMPTDGARIEVVDSGRIILANEDVDNFVSVCHQRGLTVEQIEGV